MEKKNLCFRFAFLLLLLLLLPRLTLSATPPEKFYVNCGSGSNVTYGNRNFVGDINSGDNSVSLTGTKEVSNNPGSSGIYQTVRIFRHTSSYKFKLDSIGLRFVRLHFFSSSRASFTVSASSSKHELISFSVVQKTTPLVEEFLLMLNSPELELRFVPDRSSLAFVNAIEVFPVPPNDQLTEIVRPDSDNNLHVIYRLNVGGAIITPENDTLGRTWSLDDEFLYRKDSAANIGPTRQKPNYEIGSVAATDLTAPDFVYRTAKTINRSTSEHVSLLMNVTWSFKVKSNSKHFIRYHFSDIKSSQSQNPDSDFYLFVNAQTRQDVQPSSQRRLMTPFYIDVVNVSDGSGFLNVSIGTKDANKDAGFLNGLEVMEFLRDSHDSSSKGFRIYVIVSCVVAASVVFLGMLLFMVFLKRRKSKKKKRTPEEASASVWSPLQLHRGGGSSGFDPVNNSPLRNFHLGLKIPLTDILRATNSFDEKWLIGRGGFGDVYKGVLPDGGKAAIKRGKGGSGQGILEFQTEIQVLSRIRHRHLVSLTGYCEENSEMILVYEFMERGTLREHLYGSGLTWKQRLEICIGAARGLHYLHSGSEGAIIHRDVKSTNILLDENNVAKVADFGLSKLTVRNQDQDQINSISTIKGTFGYLDPEYLQTHVLTEKSDVYAFGVVLLEVLCARPALDPNLPHEEVNLAEWAMFCKSKGLIDEILDPKLTGQIEPSSLRKFMEIVEKCLNDYGEGRPSMGDVVWDLEYVLQLQMMTNIHREPHEDSAVTMNSGDGSFVIPRLLMTTDSFSSNSIVQKNGYGGTDSSEENQVFSQLNMSEAR